MDGTTHTVKPGCMLLDKLCIVVPVLPYTDALDSWVSSWVM